MTGNQLRKLLEELNITQEIAANRLGVTVRTLQNWINKDELDEKISRIINSGLMTDSNIAQHTNSHNINGNGNKVNSETDKFLDLLKKKDEQIDRLITLLEK